MPRSTIDGCGLIPPAGSGPPSHLRYGRRDSGVVLVETAISVPVLLLMIFAIVELGLMFRDYAALRGSALDAVRSAVIAGNEADADHLILSVVKDSASVLPTGSLETIVIYRADTPGAPVPASCLNTSLNTAAIRCNRYTVGDLDEPVDAFGCDSQSDIDSAWCPTERSVTRSEVNGGPPDNIGVHLVARRRMLTGLIGSEQTLHTTAVLRIEPREP